MSLISCKHICWVKFQLFFYTILSCILVQVYCSEHDPLNFIRAEKFCFTIVKIEICQLEALSRIVSPKGNLWIKWLIWLVLNNKIKESTAINAKLHVSLLDSCSILDSLWNNDHRTLHLTQKPLDSGTLFGAYETAESSPPCFPPAIFRPTRSLRIVSSLRVS